MWGKPLDLDAEYNKLEAELAATAKVYPASAARMCQPLVNSVVEQVNADLRAIDADLAAAGTE
jgi:hypothetical protein